MTSPNKPTSKPSRVAKIIVKPIWRKKLNPYNTSIELNCYGSVISSPNHPTSNIEDAFSSNFPDYIPVSPDYFLASPENTSSESLNNSFGLVPIASPTLSLFHNDPYMKVMQAYDAISPPQVTIPPPTIVPPSLMPPKRRSTSEESAMTHAAIRKLVADSVTTALEAQAATMAIANLSTSMVWKELLVSFAGLNELNRYFSRSNYFEKNKVKFAINTLTEEALFWWNSFAQPIRVEEAYKITWSEFKRLLIKKYCPQTEIKKMEEAITMTQKLIEQVMKHNFVQETNNHKRKLEDRRNTTNGNNNNYRNNNHSNDHHQQQNMRQETFKAYTANKGYTGNRPLCKRCTLHHIGPCTVRCQTCNKEIEQLMARSGTDLKMAKLGVTPSGSHSPSSSDHQSSSVHYGVAAEHSVEVNPFAPADNEPFVNIFSPDPNSEASSSGEITLAESNQSTQPHEHLQKWIDSHPIDNIIGNPSRLVST
ncbi:hypothetical protein Tco_0671816 [Tanacetum coccineum]